MIVHDMKSAFGRGAPVGTQKAVFANRFLSTGWIAGRPSESQDGGQLVQGLIDRRFFLHGGGVGDGRDLAVTAGDQAVGLP